MNSIIVRPRKEQNSRSNSSSDLDDTDVVIGNTARNNSRMSGGNNSHRSNIEPNSNNTVVSGRNLSQHNTRSIAPLDNSQNAFHPNLDISNIEKPSTRNFGTQYEMKSVEVVDVSSCTPLKESVKKFLKNFTDKKSKEMHSNPNFFVGF